MADPTDHDEDSGDRNEDSADRADTTQAARALLPAWLFLVVVAVLTGATLLSTPSALSLLKIAAIAVLAVFPAWLYNLFLWRRGPSLYDEYVLNLFRLHIDEYRNLPMPPRHTSYYPPWRAHHTDLQRLTADKTKDNL